MGGKTKNTQRTKNNTRPSNSGRSAELLGSTIPHFAGFSGHSALGVVSPTTGFAIEPADNVVLDANIDSQFQLVFRKMSKKDPLTKSKSLQELVELVKASEMETVKAILPMWSKTYHHAANDVDPRVREYAQAAHSAIVETCGKNIAPHLKQLVPVWITCRFDTCTIAANTAVQSFNKAFPTNKLTEVFTYCANENFQYFSKNLFGQMEPGLGNVKLNLEKDLESKYERLVSSNLKAYASCLANMNQDKLADVMERHENLVRNEKFWHFPKHSAGIIRAAWYECLSAILLHIPQVLTDFKQKCADIVFQHIADTDPGVAPQVWSCVLLFQVVYDDWYKCANFKKVVLPKLSLLLKNGGFGNAVALCPHYLPFISKMNELNMEGLALDDFYDEFFGAMKVFLTSPPNMLSKSDITANVSAFYECLRYVIQKKISNSSEDKSSQHTRQLVENHVNDIVSWSIKCEGQIPKNLYSEISTCVTNWSQNATKSIMYTHLTDRFWQNLTNILDEVENFESNVKVELLFELIECLYVCSPKYGSNRVKFSIDDTSKIETKEMGQKNKVVLHVELKPICIRLTKLLIKSISSGNSERDVILLKKMCDLASDSEFYMKLSDNNDLNATLLVFQHLLTTTNTSELIIDIIFDILRYVDKRLRANYLGDILMVDIKKVHEWVLQRILSHPFCLGTGTKDFLSQRFIAEIILRLAQETVVESSSDKLGLLQKCFFQDSGGNIMINTETSCGIIKIMSDPLLNEQYTNVVDTCGSFISQITPVIFSTNSPISLQQEVFLKLFQFSLNMNSCKELPEDTLYEITTCWQDALSSEDVELDEELMKKCANLISNRLKHSNTQCDDVTYIAKLACNLVICSNEGESNDQLKVNSAILLVNYVFGNDLNQTMICMENYNDYAECLQDDYTPSNVINLTMSTSEDIISLFRMYFFYIQLVFMLTCETKPPEEEHSASDENMKGKVNPDYDTACSKKELIKTWSESMYEYLVKGMKLTSMGSALIQMDNVVIHESEELVAKMKDTLDVLLIDIPEEIQSRLEKKMLALLNSETESWTKLLLFLINFKPYVDSESSALALYQHCMKDVNPENHVGRLHILQTLLPVFQKRQIPINAEWFASDIDISLRVAGARVLIRNYFSADSNSVSDKNIIQICQDLLSEIIALQKSSSEFLLYNENIAYSPAEKVINVTEIVKFIADLIKYFPSELNVYGWDFIRIAISSWILVVSKTVDSLEWPQITIFTAAVYKLHSVMFNFFAEEKQKSSTVLLTNVIDEWENLFALETNLVLFKTFYSVLSNADKAPIGMDIFYDCVCPHMEYLDYSLIFNAFQKGFQISLDDCITFLLRKFSNKKHSVRLAAVGVFRRLLNYLVKSDIDKVEKRSTEIETADNKDWHLLCKMYPYIRKYNEIVNEYIQEFSYKVNEVTGLRPMDRESMIGYLLLWDCVILACSYAPGELRSCYAQWITINQLDQQVLQFLFRAMPIELLKNYDSKIVNHDMFRQLEWTQIKDKNLSFERYVCHLYTQMLTHLPAVVRKWWNESSTRQRTFVDKFTTNYVSNLICQEELYAITSKKEKHENMQITVHNSTREVIAKYSIDETKMELVISLAPNHPLGAAKIESEKQIGGRLQSRVVIRQLTIFLTHQNGSILDALSLWKKNLDKKFEGVEECYVCYSVIHQDTCQLPKLTCKTCRKKFHGPCLYKWFTTSSKSTCPICRNVF